MQQQQPWALFVGMKRPHLNFFAPQWAFSAYNKSNVPIASNRLPSHGMPREAFFQNAEISGDNDIRPYMYTYLDERGQRFELLREDKHQELKWAYRAAVTFMDSQVQRVLDAMDDLKLHNNTWIVFLGDHGWSLGEHGEWAKQNNFEEATRVPLVIVPPFGPAGSAYARNSSFQGIVELVDVYPTIMEVMGLQDAGVVPKDQLEGVSLAQALRTGGWYNSGPMVLDYPMGSPQHISKFP